LWRTPVGPSAYVAKATLFSLAFLLATAGSVLATPLYTAAATATEHAAISAGPGTVTGADDETAVDGFCDRTQQVRDAIVGEIQNRSACEDVTAADLLGITGTLKMTHLSISALKPGDFDGLGNLTGLELSNNSLTGLPADVFDDLTELTELWLDYNSLASLPADVFDDLTELTTLGLHNNSLAELPAGVFDNLTELTVLVLLDNSLTALPAGMFRQPDRTHRVGAG